MAQVGNQPSLSIAEMGPYHFWTRARALDLSESDREAVTSGHASEDQVKRLAAAFEAGRERLAGLPGGIPAQRIGVPH